MTTRQPSTTAYLKCSETYATEEFEQIKMKNLHIFEQQHSMLW